MQSDHVNEMVVVAQCLNKHVVASEEDLCFFQKDENLHLIVKPERRCYIEPAQLMLYIESKKKVRVQCKQCNCNVGCEVPYGPKGNRFLAFSNTKILFDGIKLEPTQKWIEIASKYPTIQIRSENNYLQDSIENDAKPCSVEDCEPHPLIWPKNNTEFQFQGLEFSKVPRKYQIEVYLEALQRDLVAVLPTGAGKTFIASMLMARLQLLNPNRLGLFVVKTVPLVFQQADAINGDCGLSVCPLCGENKTAAKLRGLTNGEFQILVVTAGVLKELLRSDKLNFGNFYCFVIDEVHHVGNNNDDYTQLVQMWSTSNVPNQRPRLLGLTASPFKVSSYPVGIRNMNILRDKLENTVIFKPVIAQSHQNTHWHLVSISDEQVQFFNEMVKLLQKVCNIINTEIKSNLQITNHIVKNYSSQLKREVKSLELKESHRSHSLSLVNTLLAIIELSYHISTEQAVTSLSMLTENIIETCNSSITDAMVDVVKKFSNSRGPSPRLKVLYEVLETRDPQCSRGVVFVDTRNTARVLCETLERSKPEWLPKLFVGRGGYDGMHWRNDQEFRMDEFRDGQTHLLIATSVLEEGIDVPQCDLVVRFSPVKSLISYVQSRGRARKINAQFIMIVTEEEKQKALKVVENEKLLDQVLKNHTNEAQIPTKHTQELMHQLAEGHPNTVWIADSNEATIQFEEISMEIYFGAFSGSEVDMKLSVIDSIEKSCKIKVKHVDVKRHSAAIRCGASNVFPTSDTTALLSIKSKMSTSSFEDIWTDILCNWDFLIQNDSRTLYAFVRFPMIPNFPAFTSRGFEVAISMGKFINKNRFKKVLEVEDGFLGFDDQIISVFSGSSYSFDILRETIASFIYVSSNLSSRRYQLFVPLKSLPIYGETVRVGGPFSTRVVFIRSTFSTLSTPLPSIAEYPVFLFEIEYQKFDSILEFFKTFENSGISILFFRMSVIEEAPLNITSKFLKSDEKMDEEQFMCWWYLSVINSEMNLFLPDKILESMCSSIEDFSTRKNSKKIAQMTSLLQQLFYESKFFPYWSSIEDRYFDLKGEIELLNSNINMKIPDSHHLMKRLVVTPGRIIFKPEALYPHSRITRQFMDRLDFLIVSFKDEQEQRLPISDIDCHFESILSKGLKIGSRQYLFLCASASQMRAHSSYFVWIKCGNMSIEDIRKEIISNYEEFSSSAKKLSRLSLYCTGDRQTISLHSNEVYMIDDISAESGDLLTDGAGKITDKCAEKIAFHLNLDEVPSVFQIRYAGIKGVVVKVNPLTDEDFQNLNQERIKLLYRPSMQKFINGSTELNVVNYSRYLDLHLNHEIILLLLALHSLDENSEFVTILLDMHTDYIKTLGKCFSNKHAAQALLVQYFPKQFIQSIVGSGIDILTEPFWFSVISGIFNQCFKDLTVKARIPVKNGCLLLGVPDPLGILKDGEVFLCIKNAQNNYSAISGRVVIYRNPCLHPGDARIVKAVDIPELHYFRNCLILPAKNAAVSLASECSGGDLDGDLYGCIYDALLVPKCKSYSPLNYANLNKSPAEVSCQSMVDFYCEVMKNDALGRIATLHTSLSVFVKEGVFHPLALKVAESQAIAVDFPKTGIIPKVPKEALKMILSRLPDFIERPKSFRGISKFVTDNPLGVMFRECTSFDFEKKIGKCKFEACNRLLFEGNERFFDEAQLVYKLYEADMKRALLACDLDMEVDLVIGRPINWSEAQIGNKMKAMDSIRCCRDSLKNRYRSIFLEDPRVNNSRDILAKASAWNRVVFEKQHVEEVFHSFVWLTIPNEICMLKAFIVSNAPITIVPNNLALTIGMSVNNYLKTQIFSIRHTYSNKFAVFTQIAEAVGQIDFLRLRMFGSSSIFLCEDYSDVDIYAEILPSAYKNKNLVANEKEFMLLSQRNQEKHFLQLLISQNVERVAISKEEIFNANVPIVRCSVPLGEESKEMNVDISVNPDGWHKSVYIQRLYKMDVIVFPCFYFLMRWARFTGLIRNSSADIEPPLPTAKFYALVLHLFQNILKEIPADDVQPLNNFDILANQNLNDEDTTKLGKLLINFFEFGASMSEEVVFAWPVYKSPQHIISRKIIKLFSFRCSRTLAILTACRSVDEALNQWDFQQTQWCISLSRMFATSIGNAKSFHQEMLGFISGADVRLISKENNPFRLFLKAEGSAASISRLRKEIKHLCITGYSLSRRPRRVPKSFIEGSSIFLLKNYPSESVRIGFRDSFGPFSLMHSLKERCNPVIAGKDNIKLGDDAWVALAANNLTLRLQKQLEKFCDDQANLKLLDTMEMTLRFGNFYAINVRDAISSPEKTLKLNEFAVAMETYFATPRKNDYNISVPSSAHMEMVKLHPGNSKQPSNRSTHCSHTKNGIVTSFCPGLLASNCSDSKVVFACKSLYRKILKKFGFSESTSVCGWWRVNFHPTVNHEISLVVKDDDNKSLMQICHRPKVWFSTTICDPLHDGVNKNSKLFQSHDMRIKIVTTEDILPESELYRFCYSDGDVFPLKLDVDGQPRIGNLPDNMRKSIGYIRNVKECICFSSCDLDAELIMGKEYSGLQMELVRHFVELNFSFNISEIKNELKQSLLRKIHINESFVKSVINKAVDISNIITEEMAKLNSNL